MGILPRQQAREGSAAPFGGSLPGSARRNTRRRIRSGFAIGCAVAAGMLVVACSSSSSSSPSASSTANNSVASSLPTNGNSATFAELPGFLPNFIFPFTTPAAYGTWNLDDFQELMYRPLYWFGGSQSAPLALNTSLSLAGSPTWTTPTSFTITLKPYKWNNGETVDADDVVFWMNLYKAEEDNFGGYVPTYFPDNVISVKAVSSTVVQFNVNKAYSQNWFLFNELPQITPLPAAWDVTSLTAASGSGGCLTDSAADKWAKCIAVYKFLMQQNGDLSTYASSKIWGVVDGPWKLSAFNADGALTMVQNPDYSGPNEIPAGHKEITTFKEAPFASDAAEYNELKTNTSGVQVGYIPLEDITQPTSNPNTAGPNPLQPDYTLIPWNQYSVSYFPINFNNPTTGPMFSQLYFRQAIEESVDQPAIIKDVFHGYGWLTTNGVPTQPVNDPILAPQEANPVLAFSVSNAKSLLSSHGWNTSTSPATCQTPGTAANDCGAGIAKGAKAEFDLKYATGLPFLATEMQAFQSSASEAGIQINLAQEAGQEITAQDVACTPSKSTPCTWSAGDWGPGWVFAPDFLPTGEDLFLTGSVANYGSYNSTENNSLIEKTLSAGSTNQDMYNWENYLAQQVPVIYMPEYPLQVLEVTANLQGVSQSLNSYSFINPEDWYYTN
jgi:peptide/nickel transport system substrate-binding protein